MTIAKLAKWYCITSEVQHLHTVTANNPPDLCDRQSKFER